MRIFSIVILVFLSFSGIAQNIGGQATYESKTTFDINEMQMGRDVSEEMKNAIAERIKKMMERTYILTFNKDESLYKEEEKLENDSYAAGFRMATGSFMPGPLYKNLKTSELIEEKEFFGKEFLIVDSIPKLDWKIGKESKQIGEYTVFKAVAVKKLDRNALGFAKPKKDAAEKAKEENINPMDLIEIPEEVEIVAWFTPQIPVSNGPDEYGGLPGLILEMNMDRTTILCSKIVLNVKNPRTIERPKKGKKVSKEEYAEISTNKMKELQENFRNSGGRRN